MFHTVWTLRVTATYSGISHNKLLNIPEENRNVVPYRETRLPPGLSKFQNSTSMYP